MIEGMEIRWKMGERTGTVQVQAVYSKRRTMGLEVMADGRVLARFPRGVGDRTAREFIRQRQEWIVQKWLLMEERRRRQAARPKADYEEDPALEQAYRERARRVLKERTAYFAGIMGVTYKAVRLSSAKTRWGSCSGEGSLNFHWKLILMPPQILDYVVVHELAHRKEMNHSRAFWEQVERVLPDYRERRRWLKENGGRV